MNRQTPDDPSATTHHSKFAWLGLGSMTCAIAAMMVAFFGATDPNIALDAARIDAAAALARSGFNWANVEIEDRIALIRGIAPGEPERVMAYEVVSKALKPAMLESKIVAKVRSQLTLATPPAAPVTPEPAKSAPIQIETPVAAAGPAAAPAQSWTAPPVQFPNGEPRFAAQTATPAPIETASVDKAATPATSTCKDELSSTLASASIVFARDSATIDKQSRPVLDKLAGIAKRCSRFNLAIEGHTDGQGGKTHNLALSQRRAEAIRTALINRGVDTDHIIAQGFGSARPIEQGTTEAALAKNRRIEIAVSERTGAAHIAKPKTAKTQTSKAQMWKTETSASQTSKN